MNRVIEWVKARTGLDVAIASALHEKIPGGARWRYVFGSVLTFLFMQQVVLGILLAFYYSPSASDAWASTAYLNDQVMGGWFLRGLHHHGSSAMVIVVVLHMLQVVWAGAYRAPREVNWWTGLAMGGLVLAFALTGYLLPWDQKGYWATQVATGIMGSVPGGEPLQQLIQGGPEYGNLTLTRFFALHVFVLPLALAGLLIAHIALFRRHGVTPPAQMDDAELKRKTQMFWPNQLFLDVAAMTICAIILIAVTFKTHGSALYAPADPASNFVARPEWYFLFLFQLLKYFEGPLQIVATVLLPGAVAVTLFALPWIDRSPTRRPRSRWQVLSIVGLLMAGVTALTALAMVEDSSNETYQKGLVLAEKEAERSRALAKQGVPPAGGLALLDNDPRLKAHLLFKQNCASCHDAESKDRLGPVIGPGHGDRAWFKAFIRNPNADQFWGRTKLSKTEGAMKPFDQMPDADLDAVVELLYSESGAKDVDEAKRKKGLTVFETACSDCHAREEGMPGSSAPGLAGVGSRTFFLSFITNPKSALHMGAEPDRSEMPRFDKDLTLAERDLLAGYLVWLRTATPADVAKLEPLQ
jgi:ubiquinol-cytochrome c reductase cytochrome b subunit